MTRKQRCVAPTDDQIAAALNASGGLVKVAAVALGCSATPIIKYRRRVGLTGTRAAGPRTIKFPAEKVLEALSRHNGDVSAVIAELGCSEATVQTIRRKAGLPVADPKRLGPKKQFTDEMIAEALEKTNQNLDQAARLLGCSLPMISQYRLRHGIRVTRRSTVKKIDWTPANVERLRAASMVTPRPSNVALSNMFGTTIAAIQTALSRHGITKWSGVGAGSVRDLTTLAKRNCITCDGPFLSEGKHNRMCPQCRVDASEMVA